MAQSQEKPDYTTGTREGSWQDEVFTRVVRAGSRTYYFDVKTIRDNSKYITITESKRKVDSSGNPFYLKHKIFLYQEDFEKFTAGLIEAIDFIRDDEDKMENSTEIGVPSGTHNSEQEIPDQTDFTDVNFDDLGDK